MSEPMFEVRLSRAQVLGLLKDAQSSHFPELDSLDETVSFFRQMGDWYKDNREPQGPTHPCERCGKDTGGPLFHLECEPMAREVEMVYPEDLKRGDVILRSQPDGGWSRVVADPEFDNDRVTLTFDRGPKHPMGRKGFSVMRVTRFVR